MRPARLVVLIGTLTASVALYLRHLAVDGGAFRELTGVTLPSVWQELGGWGRPAAALVAAALVAAAFRPTTGRVDRWGGWAALGLAAGAAAGWWLAWQAARHDAAVVTVALGRADAGEAASAGRGFWLLAVGTGVVVAGLLGDLWAARRRPAGQGAGGDASVGEQDSAPLE